MPPQANYCSACLLVEPHNFIGVLSIKAPVFLTAGRHDRHRSRVSPGFSTLTAQENHPGSFAKCRCLGPPPEKLT